MSKRQSLIKFFTELYYKSRPLICLILVVIITISPLIPNLYWRIGVLSLLASTVLLLVLDLFKEINKRLDKIDANLDIDAPPTFEDFTDIIPNVRNILLDKLKENKDVNIKIIAVSAQFSWRILIEDTIPDFLNIGNKSPKIEIELLIVKPDILNNWGQKKLRMDCERTISGKSIFDEKLQSEINKGRLIVDVMIYDNIPHWHGVMIDNEILFMGRCKWDMTKKKKELLVGQKEYRLFTTDDRFQGNERVELFTNWFDAYKLRAEKIEKPINNNNIVQKNNNTK